LSDEENTTDLHIEPHELSVRREARVMFTGIFFLLFKMPIYFIHISCFKLLNLNFDLQRVSTADLEVVGFINIKKKISTARERQILREDLDIIWYDTPHGKRWYDYIGESDIFCLRNLFNEDNYGVKEEEEDEDL
jgi:hypothetical protein